MSQIWAKGCKRRHAERNGGDYRTSHLKGSEGQVKEDLIIFSDGLTETHKDHVVDPKQRDEQQGGLGQPPDTETQTFKLQTSSLLAVSRGNA